MTHALTRHLTLMDTLLCFNRTMILIMTWIGNLKRSLNGMSSSGTLNSLKEKSKLKSIISIALTSNPSAGLAMMDVRRAGDLYLLNVNHAVITGMSTLQSNLRILLCNVSINHVLRDTIKKLKLRNARLVLSLIVLNAVMLILALSVIKKEDISYRIINAPMIAQMEHLLIP